MDGLTVGKLGVLMYADHAQLINGFDYAERAGQQAANNLQAKWDAASRKLQTAGTVMSAAVTAPILAVGGAVIKLASDLEETNNKVSVAFGDSAKQIEEWSKTSIEKMGMAAQTAKDSAALYGDMATGMGIAQSEAAPLAMSMTQLAGDLASFKNIQIDVAKTALAGVFTGETESLKQLGIVMTETNLQQFAMSQGIQKNIADMSQAEKVQLRYAYILSVTGNAQGDFARTSDGAANQMRMASEQAKELGASIGQQLLPMAVDALKGVNKLVKGFTDMSPAQKQAVITTVALVAAIGPAIKIFGLLEKSGKASQAVFKAFSAQGFIGQMIAASAASKAQTAAGTAAATATTVQAKASAAAVAAQAAHTQATAAAAVQTSMFAVAGTEATGAIATKMAAELADTGQMSMFTTAEMGAAAGATAQAAATTAAAAGTAAAGTASAAATPAVTGFGAAMQFALGPIALIGAALALVIPILSNLNSEANAVSKEIEKVNESFNSTIEAAAAAKKEIEGTAGAATGLAQKLYALEAKENKTNVEKQQMINLVTELNSLYPDLGLKIDSVTGALNRTAAETESVIAAMKKQALAAAFIDDWVKLEKDRLAAVEAQKKAENALAAAVDRQKNSLSSATGTMSSYIGGVTTSGNSLKDATAAVEAITTAQDKLNAIMNDSTEPTDNLAEAIIDIGVAYEDLSEKQQEAVEAMGLSLEDLSAMTEEELDAQITAWQENQDAMQELYDKRAEVAQSHFDAMSDITSKGIKEEGTSLKDATRNLNENVADYRAWKNDIEYLAQTLPPNVISYLESLGPEQARVARELADKVKNGGDWQSFSGAVEGMYSLANELATAEIGKTPGLVTGALDATSGAVSGYTGVTDAMGEMGKDAGETLTDEASTAIKSNTNKVVNEATNTANKASRSMIVAFQQQYGPIMTAAKTIGTGISQGMAAGIRAGESSVINAAIRIARAAIAAAKEELGINSPSRIFAEIGEGVPEGFALGIERASMLPVAAVAKMAEISSAALARPITGGQSNTYDQRRYNDVRVAITGGASGAAGRRSVWELEDAIGRAVS